MRINLALILSIILAVGIVALGFTWYQINSERTKLDSELERRVTHIADEIFQNTPINPEVLNNENIEWFSDSISARYNLTGLTVYYRNDSIFCAETSLDFLNNSLDYISQSIAADTAIGTFFHQNGKDFFQYIKPVSGDDVVTSAVVFYSDAEYIDNIINSIWLRNFFRWFIQALFVSLVTVLIIRWGIFSPISKVADWVKLARSGNIDILKKQPPAEFLAPLHKEIIHIAKEIQAAKATAEEEARLRASGEAVWTAERLKVEMENLLHNKKMIVVSNREPYMHIHEGKNIKCIVPASGMITAMEPVLKACGGLWIASGTGDADRETVNHEDKIQVPPENPAYTLKRLWQSKEEEDHFYYGFSNEGLWPLCHIAHTRPVFRKVDWQYYKKVNEDFARAVLDEIAEEEQPYILIQDYHFSLLPGLIKSQRPDAKVALFWHIPWPNPESFGICPWQREILMGMLGADLIGFHTQYHCNNFLETVNNALESRVLWENFSVKIGAQTTFVKPFPISIAFSLFDPGTDHPFQLKSPTLLNEYGNVRYLGIGVDRIDYTKGIVEKFFAIERFLEKNPSCIGKFTFIQIGAPSRTLIKSYADTLSAIENEANRINWKFKSKNWKAIHFLKRHHSHEEIEPFYSSADFCMVSSLHDGMNLVAKEFVAARHNNDGALIISRFAGAAQELRGAILINPYDIEKSADAIKFALEMPLEEQMLRMKQMRQVVGNNNVYRWAANLLKSLAAI